MKRTVSYKICVAILTLVLSVSLCGRGLALVEGSGYSKNRMLSRVDLKRYFEKAMSLFESGKYKEAVVVLESLIEIESSQRENYFTPFAEIYIEKSKARMREMFVLEDRKWARMKKKVVDEVVRIAQEESDGIAREKEAQILREEKIRRRAVWEAERKEIYELEEEVKNKYAKAMQYYKEQNYPASIVEFKKVRELDPNNRLVAYAESYIEKAQVQIKKYEERRLLARMEAARLARLEMEREKKRQELEQAKRKRERQIKEREKERLRKVFEARLRARELRDRIARTEELMDKIRRHVAERRFEEAENVLHVAMLEFPESERFKDILHYVNMEKIKMEEKALKRAREIVEEKMLLEVAKKHMIPEEKFARLESAKKITPLVKVPEIRRRLKIPISVVFDDVELDYVLGFLSNVTGVNIIPSSEIDMEEKKVSIKIKDMPLEDALRYILKTQELIYRIEEDAVWVATREEMDNEQVETRVYFLNQGIGRFAEFTGTFTEESGHSGSTEVKTVQDILEQAVDWPKDSKLTLDNRTGALIISNIPSNLEIVENLIYNLDVTPKQILIEARFLDVKVTDIDELGFEWQLNSDWGTKQNNAKQNLHGFASNSGVNFSDFTTNKDYGFNLTYQGILSHPQFQAVLHAFQQKQNVKTLSAPRIATLNNQTATIEVIDEVIYPTRYEVSLVQYDINGDGDFDDAGETEWANIPQDFVTRDVGILLHVKPSVGVDNKTITLALTPEVSEQDSGSDPYSYSGSVSIPNFKTRNLSTTIVVQSGETVVMGGLISESNTHIKTKVPLLGDLPFIGGLFRKNSEGVERRNLLIFVTAIIMGEEEEIAVSASQGTGQDI